VIPPKLFSTGLCLLFLSLAVSGLAPAAVEGKDPPALWDAADPSSPAKTPSSQTADLKARLTAAQEEGDAALTFVLADLLSSLEPEQFRWENVRNEAGERLAGRTAVPDLEPLFKKRLREAAKELQSAELMTEEAGSEAELEKEVAQFQKTAAQLKREADALAVKNTLLAEEEDGLIRQMQTEPSDELADRLKRVTQERKRNETERLAIDEKTARLEKRLAESRDLLTFSRQRDSETGGRLLQTQTAYRTTKKDSAYFGLWKDMKTVSTKNKKAAAKGKPPEAPPDTEDFSSETQGPPAPLDEVRPSQKKEMRPPAPPKPAAPAPKKPAVPAAPPAPPFLPAPSALPQPAVVHPVQEGETLPSLAQKYYGDPARWREIYEANAHAILRGVLEPGQRLLIPQGEKRQTP